jgi:hypothetical protein
MARIEAVERVAHGLACDTNGCDVIVPVRNPTSKCEGYYVTVERVTEALNHYITEELFFHSKDCMLATLTYGLNHGPLQPMGNRS